MLLGAQDLWDYVQDSVLLREDFAPGGFSAAVEPLLDVEGDLSSILLYKRTGTAVAASDQSEGFLSSKPAGGGLVSGGARGRGLRLQRRAPGALLPRALHLGRDAGGPLRLPRARAV